MKLNVRFLLTTFVIVLIISISSTFIFYSLANRLLMNQQSKTLINATTNLAFSLQTELQNTDEEFRRLVPKISNFSSIELDSFEIDFLFTLVNDSLINTKEFKVKSNSYLNLRSSSFKKFFTDNQASFLRYAQLKDGKTYYYGRVISTDFLNKLRVKINAEIALVVNESPIEVSMYDGNQIWLQSVINSAKDLKQKNNFDLYSEELDDADFVSAIYSPRFVSVSDLEVNFIVFQVFKEGVDFRNTLQMVMFLIVLAGTAITFIIVVVSTAKLRKQIEALSIAAEETRKGNLEHRVPVITKDEIGHFGETFNKMLDELARNKKAEKEYSEFLALINQKPTLKEIADAALSKIIKSTHLTFGALYFVENKNYKLISSYGIGKHTLQLGDSVLFADAIEKKGTVDFRFHDNYPEIKAGMASVKIKYLVVYPVLYNKEVIAVLELASESNPDTPIENYLDTIHEQLAVGLVNAKSFEQLENIVVELQRLNDEYQKQNLQIVEQNDELKRLHNQLKEKAEELEKQRTKAIELTKVKSDFLASMSHELRTPLISILGLTELMLKDSGVLQKVKDRLGIVNRNGKKLLGLINNILEFSKFESGKIELKKVTCILSDLIDEIKPNIFHLAVEKNLKLVFELPEGKTILLNTDKEKLEQVLLNLIVNAIKFTEAGYIKVKIELRNLSDLHFEVIDTGIGISEEDQKIIFKEFKQADGSASRKYNGAGLGLAISKKYIELLGGVLMLKSELGKGSSFSFRLHDSVLEAVESSEHKFLTIDDNIELSAKNLAAKLPVLLITDSQSTRNIISDYLASYSIQCEYCKSCSQAEHLVYTNKYTAIILNPFENTFNFISSIKASKNNKSTPILIIKILDELKYGWGPNIYDFVVKENFEVYPVETITKLEEELFRNIRNIFIVTEDLQNEVPVLLAPAKTFYKRISPDEIFHFSKLEKPDVIFIDVDSVKENTYEICYSISSNRELKNCPVVFLLPLKLDMAISKIIVEAYERIASRVKMHPLDILKVIRDRLSLSELADKNKVILIEERGEAENVVEKRKKKNSKQTILIVDDDDDALYTVGEYVKELGYDTVFAHNGMECLLMLNYVKPDLILLDIMMPQMDGFETIRRIRDENRFMKLPVIALTAYAMLDNHLIIEKNGFDDLVTKPINFQSLSTKILEYLSK
ncbi:MAG: GAF sensor hybrid histidine kinase [Ignavibacteria bacterium]|nr:MAG: GAF sensor hybrid histidine kinase [Ignavibacteria bacterium]KAF0160601.1 MAG: GAF sensor hybrid histidine kinase [Ignavibacteria bacterium]